MAGIGFEITKLTRRDNLIDVAGAFFHTAMASVGPWLFTVISLAIITLLAGGEATPSIVEFRTIIIYNFSISLVLSAPIFLVATRILSDAIHTQDVTCVPAAMFKCIALVLLVHLPVALLWYVSGFYTLSVPVKMMAFANIFLISVIWVLTVFIMGLKDYMAVSKTFLWGHVVAIALVLILPKHTALLLGCFNLGLVIIAALLIARIMAEYPYRPDEAFALTPYLKTYWPIALGGLFYNAGIWVDKWILWFAPEATQLASKMRIFPDYDQAMFIAILFTVPAFVMFVFSVETNFFHHYRRFFGDILNHRPLSRIFRRKGELIGSVHEGARQLLLMQGVLSVVGFIMAASIIAFMHARPEAITMFRFGVLGGFFHLLMLLATIILSYFDCRKQNMWIYAVFCFTNIVVTLITYGLGYHAYGFGYFFASALSFVIAVAMLFAHLRNLTYHTFITNNVSVQQAQDARSLGHEPTPVNAEEESSLKR